VQYQFLYCEIDERVGARIGLSRAKHDRSERCDRGVICGCCPRNQLVRFIYLRRSEDCARKLGSCLAAIRRRGNYAECAAADPRAAAFISKRRTPPATASDFARLVPPVCDRTGSRNYKYSGGVAERVSERDLCVRYDANLVCYPAGGESPFHRSALFIASNAREASNQDGYASIVQVLAR
jgi:hypothetical protein